MSNGGGGGPRLAPWDSGLILVVKPYQPVIKITLFPAIAMHFADLFQVRGSVLEDLDLKLVEGEGDSDNDLFGITTTGALQSLVSLDHEAQDSTLFVSGLKTV